MDYSQNTLNTLVLSDLGSQRVSGLVSAWMGSLLGIDTRYCRQGGKNEMETGAVAPAQAVESLLRMQLRTPDMVVHTCNPSLKRQRGWRIRRSSRSSWVTE